VSFAWFEITIATLILFGTFGFLSECKIKIFVASFLRPVSIIQNPATVSAPWQVHLV
jgi:hypothetical protein